MNHLAIKIYASLCSSFGASISPPASGRSVSPAQWNLSGSHAHADSLPLSFSSGSDTLWWVFTRLHTGLHSDSNNFCPTNKHFSKSVHIFLLRSMTTGWRTCTWITGWPCRSTPALLWCFLSRRSEIIKMHSGMCWCFCCCSDFKMFASYECLNFIHPLTVLYQRLWWCFSGRNYYC